LSRIQCGLIAMLQAKGEPTVDAEGMLEVYLKLAETA
jgi:hypothetical protein